MDVDGDDAAISYRDWTVESLTQRIRLTVFPESPGLVVPCAMFLLERGQEKRPSTREKYPQQLGYLSRYIQAYGSSYGIRVTEYSDFSTSFIAGFLNWLRGKGGVVPRVNDANRLSKVTAANIYKLARDLVAYIKASERFSHLCPQGIVFDMNPSDKGYRDIKSIPGLSEAELIAIRSACFTELEVTFENLRAGQSNIADDQLVVPDLRSPGKAFKNLDVCVKGYHSVQGLKLSPAEFRHRFPGLNRALHGPPYHDLGSVLRRLHFTKRSIVPVVVLLGMHFAFEPDTHVQLDWEHEKDSFLYGPNRGVVGGEKYRGGFSIKSKPYVRRDKRRFSPGALFEMLRLVTPETAKHISAECTRIFCFARRDGSFGYFSSSNQFQKSLDRFIYEHGLTHFTLANLRKSGADIVAKVTGGDIAEQKVFLRHKTVNTTLKSYQSPSNVARREEQLAHAQNVRARRIRTKGKVETRGACLPGGQRLAATIGFYCLDPYDSPQVDQSKGELCNAYGRCPSCPLAQIDGSSSRDYCRLEQVRNRLIDARGVLDPSRWQVHWAPQLEALENVWMPAFSAVARQEAAQLTFPSIPEIE